MPTQTLPRVPETVKIDDAEAEVSVELKLPRWVIHVLTDGGNDPAALAEHLLKDAEVESRPPDPAVVAEVRRRQAAPASEFIEGDIADMLKEVAAAHGIDWKPKEER